MWVSPLRIMEIKTDISLLKGCTICWEWNPRERSQNALRFNKSRFNKLLLHATWSKKAEEDGYGKRSYEDEEDGYVQGSSNCKAMEMRKTAMARAAMTTVASATVMITLKSKLTTQIRGLLLLH